MLIYAFFPSKSTLLLPFWPCFFFTLRRTNYLSSQTLYMRRRRPSIIQRLCISACSNTQNHPTTPTQTHRSLTHFHINSQMTLHICPVVAHSEVCPDKHMCHVRPQLWAPINHINNNADLIFACPRAEASSYVMRPIYSLLLSGRHRTKNISINFTYRLTMPTVATVVAVVSSSTPSSPLMLAPADICC